MSKTDVPFNRPPVIGPELENIRQALTDGKLAGDGGFTKLCHAWLEERLGAQKALLTHSCTGALEMAAMLCDLKRGDEVIMPSFTFVSTANAVVLRGAIPVFVDIDPATQNIDPAAAEAAVTDRTRAIFVVHYAGVPCDMGALASIAQRHGLFLVEDAAQALGSTYEDRPAGALSDFAAFSFHETKNTVSGEGGALIINRAEQSERAEIIREKGTDRSRFLRGDVDKYTWVDIGSSYLPSEIVAAFLYAQLQNVDQVVADRLTIWSRYHGAFAELEEGDRIKRPVVPANVTHNGHIYYLLMRDAADRNAFIETLGRQGIKSAFHYVPLHSSPAGQKFGQTAGSMDVTNSAADRLVRLPMFYGMGGEMQDRVIEAATTYLVTTC